MTALSLGLFACGGDAFGDQDGGLGASSDSGPSSFPSPDLGPPRETEVDVIFEPPAVGRTVLYATNPAGRVAVVSAADFSIETVAVGADPMPAVAAPGRDLAVSLNRGSRSVSVLRTADGRTAVVTVELAHDANRVEFSPDGRYAVVFEGPSDTRSNFQDLSVLALGDDEVRATRAVVGFGPSRVFFAGEGNELRALVVTEDGVSVLVLDELSMESVARPPLLSFGARVLDTSVTADGAYAIGIVPSEGELRQLDLTSAEVQVARLPRRSSSPSTMDAGVPDAGPDAGILLDERTPFVSDLDLSPQSDAVFAVLREEETVLRLPVGDDFGDAESWTTYALDGDGVGSVELAADGSFAVGFTTVFDREAIVVLDLTEPDAELAVRRLPLRKTVLAVALDPTGVFALVLHRSGDGSPNQVGIPEAERIDRSDGYSLVDLDSGFVRLTLTPAAPSPSGVVLDASGDYLFLALRDDASGVRLFQSVDLRTFAVDELPLLAPPTTLGTFPDLDRAFVGQEADGGRVTFYSWLSRESQTIAGFELGAGIRR